ncbi:hypothetical protein [Archaeoglobus veneficus]|uniref:Uncharacterized protein n=1 Tax=Archaeoglobus veneficus (strain DSM 11195 / SNP6) TaxID=693661 RepID=F2KQ88_ARCVS|nr:hypothetical protein [Archaeoglobus veneficus]AEA46521.1 hypothetical protein Arcve_0492 [Archaeoglobus veneficus SNP6]
MIEVLRIKEADGNVIIKKEDFEKLIAELESLIETLEVLGDRDLMEQIKKSEEDILKGNIVKVESVDEFKKLLK